MAVARKRKPVRRPPSNKAKRFTRKANTPKRGRQWKHVYRSALKRGYPVAKAIAQASGVIKREVLKRNPAKLFNIEALVLKGTTPHYLYWDDPNERFTDKRPQGSVYKSQKSAYIEAKKLMPRLPKEVASLRVVPA